MISLRKKYDGYMSVIFHPRDNYLNYTCVVVHKDKGKNQKLYLKSALTVLSS